MVAPHGARGQVAIWNKSLGRMVVRNNGRGKMVIRNHHNDACGQMAIFGVAI